MRFFRFFIFSYLVFFSSRFLSFYSLCHPQPHEFSSQDFPYNFEAGIEHANVWALAPLSTRQLEALIEEKRPATDFETVWYVNPAALASIPDVWHAHVLSRRRRRPREEDSE